MSYIHTPHYDRGMDGHLSVYFSLGLSIYFFPLVPSDTIVKMIYLNLVRLRYILY